MTRNRLTVGKVEVVSVSDGRIEFATNDFFPDVPREAWTPYRGLLGDGHELLLNLGSCVLLSEGKTVLVDAGLGEGQSGPWKGTGGGLIADLERNGIGVGDVDIVVFTHLHPDHVGWSMTRAGGEAAPTFPNARYWVPKADWALFERRDRMRRLDYFSEQVRPLADMGLMELTEGETALTGEVSTLPTPGHTPGHTCVAISSGKQKGIVLGDAIHHPAQITEPGWTPSPDHNPRLSAETRTALVQRLEADDAVGFGGHFRSPGFGRVARKHGRRYWQPL